MSQTVPIARMPQIMTSCIEGLSTYVTSILIFTLCAITLAPMSACGQPATQDAGLLAAQERMVALAGADLTFSDHSRSRVFDAYKFLETIPPDDLRHYYFRGITVDSYLAPADKPSFFTLVECLINQTYRESGMAQSAGDSAGAAELARSAFYVDHRLGFVFTQSRTSQLLRSNGDLAALLGVSDEESQKLRRDYERLATQNSSYLRMSTPALEASDQLIDATPSSADQIIDKALTLFDVSRSNLTDSPAIQWDFAHHVYQLRLRAAVVAGQVGEGKVVLAMQRWAEAARKDQPLLAMWLTEAQTLEGEARLSPSVIEQK